MILRATLANVSLQSASKLAQEAGLQGTISSGFGFGLWGQEPVIIFEFATQDAGEIRKIEDFMVTLLGTFHEQAAYITRDGAEAGLIWADGRREEMA